MNLLTHYRPSPLASSFTVARILRAFLQRQKHQAIDWLRRGAPGQFSLDRWTQPMVDSLRPVMTALYQSGAEQTARHIAAQARLPVRKSFRRWRWSTKAVTYIDLYLDLYNPKVTEAIDSALFAFVQSTLDTARTEVENALSLLREELHRGTQAGESTRQLNARVLRIFDDPFKASRIAQTETQRAMNGGAVMLARETGIVKRKRWIASSDACPLCLKLAAKGEIDLDAPFHIEPKGGPYAVIMHAPAHPFCFCSVAFSLADSLVAA